MHRNVTILCSMDRTGYLGRFFLPSSVDLVLLPAGEKGRGKLLYRLLLVLPPPLSPTASERQGKELHLSSQATGWTVLCPPAGEKMTKYKNNSSHMTLDNSGFKIPFSVKANLQH